MQNIPIALAEPGMALAREVKQADNSNAPPICGRGVILTEPLLERLKNMGIQTVTVEGHPVWVEGEKSLEELLSNLDRRFKKVEGNLLMDKLKDIYRTSIVISMGKHE
ncbi:MAG: hypothetical protein FD174_3160 [Geobacteraceae bacterium]|nr:MAG: hypothetical protein FD174_3160 [Geobacteraceae bacterium]